MTITTPGGIKTTPLGGTTRFPVVPVVPRASANGAITISRSVCIVALESAKGA